MGRNSRIIEIRLLGTVDVRERGGVALQSVLAQPKRTALLAYLAAARPYGPRQRETLLALFWGERDSDRARKALRQALYFLKSSLGNSALVTIGDSEIGISSDDVWCDAVELVRAIGEQRYEDALSLYTGEFLPGFHIDDAPDFDGWLDYERERLRSTALDAAVRASEQRELAGDIAMAVQLLQRAVEIAPADERASLRLIELHSAAGDRVAGLRAYDALKKRLWRDYELEPSAEAKALAAELRGNSEAADPPIADAVAAPVRSQGESRPAGMNEMRRNDWRAHATVFYVGVAVSFIAVAAAFWPWSRDTRWAYEALPRADSLVRAGQNFAAFRLLREIETVVPEDGKLHGLLLEYTMNVSLTSTPSAVTVEVRDFFDTEARWETLGSTPLDRVRVPMAFLVWRFSREGFATREALTVLRRASLNVTLQPEHDRAMVDVPGGPAVRVGEPSVVIEPSLIDRYEVTNREYRSFISAGGYERPEYWTELLAVTSATSSLQAALRDLRDRTGRAGPATWLGGSYPEGEADHPVGGISWYEAAAFCAWAGKRLPSVYHWLKAADANVGLYVSRFGNFSSTRSETVGQPQAVGMLGTYDMAGNVKEWVWNVAEDGQRYILGGGWNEPAYMFLEYDAQDPLTRAPTFGVRCSRFAEEADSPVLAAVEPRSASPRPESGERVVEGSRQVAGDAEFANYLRLYSYDPRPLDSRVESEDARADDWRLERVRFTAAYGGDTVSAVLFLPTRTAPPYQTVIYFPGSGAFSSRHDFGDGEGQREWFLPFVRSGRAVMVPMYRGMWERFVEPPLSSEYAWRDFVIAAAKDLKRSLDYLETRPDIDTQRLAYFGLSNGALVGPIMTVVDPRFRASILVSGGFYPLRWPPEADPVHFLPRVRVPTLMINGCYDFSFDYERSQRPFFELLGAREKRHRVLEEGHLPAEKLEVIQESLDWLDRYLGPVAGRGSAPSFVEAQPVSCASQN